MPFEGELLGQEFLEEVAQHVPAYADEAVADDLLIAVAVDLGIEVVGHEARAKTSEEARVAKLVFLVVSAADH